MDLVRVENGKSMAENIKDGWDVSARAKGFLLMIENFQDKVSLLGSIVLCKLISRAASRPHHSY